MTKNNENILTSYILHKHRSHQKDKSRCTKVKY